MKSNKILNEIGLSIFEFIVMKIEKFTKFSYQMLSLFTVFTLASINLHPNTEKSFVSWMRKTNNIYTGDEYHLRLGIFLANQKYVQEHNSNPCKTFKLEMNHLAALTPSEYRSLLGFNPKIFHNAKRSSIKTIKNDAEELDWRTKGAVNPIKNQGNCGACWAFSAVLACEGAEFLKYNTLYSFSEQSLVDCVTADKGCNGGSPIDAYEYIINNCKGKLMLDSDYPYIEARSVCKFDKNKAIGHFTEVIEVKSGSETDLAAKCAQYGPVCIGIDATKASFQMYSSGIYDEPHCNIFMIDHGVGLVGYGSEGDIAYWIVRNSWGTSWGEEGYIRMIRGTNQCGEATYATCIVSE